MDCRSVNERVAAYLDGELSRGEVEQLEEHIDRCSSCATLLERLGEQKFEPCALPEEASRPEYWSAMDRALQPELDRLAAQSAGASPWWRQTLTLGAPAAVAYAAALLLALGWGAFNLTEAVEAREAAADLRLQVDRERRLAAQPASAVRVDGYQLATYTPQRGTF